jgi:undecaprenyl phosphate-alpha-L-ara4N flippase subunit ArnF
MGIVLALFSVLLTSAAQLALGYAMASLPPVSEFAAFVGALWPVHPQSALLLAGFAGYLASVYVWYLALRRLALSKAYALLSLSYVLVWLASLLLPGFHAIFSWPSLAGVLLIMSGVLVIFVPGNTSSSR